MQQATSPRIGICLLRHDEHMPPHEFAAAAEARGVHALFVPENSHVPLHRPGTIRQFSNIRRLAGFHDPFVTLSACAAATRSITLGTGVCLMTQRDPVATANAAASLDHLSEGRLVLGVAGGFIRESMEAFGSPFRKRWQIVRERVEAMRGLWGTEHPGYEGEFVSVSSSQPPITTCRAGGPPVLIGSNSLSVPRRVARYADGWITLHGAYPGNPLDDLARACDTAGRDYSDMQVVLANAPRALDAARRCVRAGYRELHYFAGGDDPRPLAAQLDDITALGRALDALP